MNVKILTESELKSCVGVGESELQAIEQAFVSLSQGQVEMPPIQRLDVREYNGEIDIKSAYIPGFASFAVKMSTGFFDNPKRGLASGSGMMILFDSETGYPQAVLLDNGYLTDVRTGLAGGVSAKYLAPDGPWTIGLIGTGKQARFQLRAAALVGSIKEVFAYGRDLDKLHQFCEQMSEELAIPVRPCQTLEEATQVAQLLITCTPAKKPFIMESHLHKGLHITAMGSDAEEKNEIHADVFRQVDRVVCDRRSQSFRLGELHHAKDAGTLMEDQVLELGEVILQSEKTKREKDNITLCDLTGTGAQDTAIATMAFKAAMEKGLGQNIQI